MENSSLTIVELQRNSPNWGKIVEEIVRLEKKTFPEHESLSKSLEDELKKCNGGLLYSAVDGGELVGYVMYTWQSSLSASIIELAVKEKYRRKGNGEALLKAAIEKCRVRKVQCICLHVDPSRAPAVTLYQKLGFRVDDVIKSYYSPDRNAYRMFLNFDDN